jgi:hypothetical protein
MEVCEAEGLAVSIPMPVALELAATGNAPGRFAACVLILSVAPEVELVLLAETAEEVPDTSFEGTVDGAAAGGADGVGAVEGEGTAEATVGRGLSGSVNWGGVSMYMEEIDI